MLSPFTLLEHTGTLHTSLFFWPHGAQKAATRREITLKSACVFFFSGAVLSLTMGENGDSCYSGGLDGSVRCWKMPDLNVDPYDNYG